MSKLGGQRPHVPRVAHRAMASRWAWAVLSALAVVVTLLAARPIWAAQANPSLSATTATFEYHTFGTAQVDVLAPATYSIETLTLGSGATSRSWDGLRIWVADTSTVLVSDTPTALGSTSVGLLATYSNGDTGTASFSIVVGCPVTDRTLVDVAVAPECLPNKQVSVLGATGVAPGESETGRTTSSRDPHQYYNSVARNDGCAACHRTHADQGQRFNMDSTQSNATECLNCHNGTGASANIQAEYLETATANDQLSGRYFRHDATAIGTGHQLATITGDGGSSAANEFQGAANRHSDCVDCHNPHATETATARQISLGLDGAGAPINVGWAISGAERSTSVAESTTAGGPRFYPYALRVNPETPTAVNFEYQLCLKCHSSFTLLPANTSGKSSQDWLDKAGEVDTDTAINPSFHPVARRGTNRTETMTASLSGPSASKLWNFSIDDTVRCTNCHARRAILGQGPGQVLSTHASPNRGILILPYRDRELIPADDTASVAWKAGRFALCFACHTDVPFIDSSTSSGTSFRFHFEHTQSIAHIGGPGGNSGLIDDPGAGNGSALCAECHFRLHSTKNAVGNQDITGTRLVNFAPNVVANPANGILRWTPRNGSSPGTCTLMCHGYEHKGTAY